MVSTNLLADIITYMIAQGVVSAGGTDAFYGTLPNKPDNLVALIEYSGNSAFSANFGNRSIQVNVRNISDSAASSKIWDVYNLFHSEDIEARIIDLTASRWAIFSCRQSPFKLKEDEKKRSIYLFNMGVLAHDEE